MIVFAETEVKIDAFQIEEIEKLIGLKFPVPYKNHLLSHNGGQCIPNSFDFYEDGRMSQSSIDWFLAIYDGEFDNLSEYIKTYKLDEKRMPSHMIPIAHDPGGNLICISCGNSDYGFIYFWDHEKETDYADSDDEDYSNLHFIANSFHEFLEKLY